MIIPAIFLLLILAWGFGIFDKDFYFSIHNEEGEKEGESDEEDVGNSPEVIEEVTTTEEHRSETRVLNASKKIVIQTSQDVQGYDLIVYQQYG